MDRVGNLLNMVLRRRGLKEHADASLALHQCRQWLATTLPLLAGSLSPLSILPDGTLIIESDHSVAAQECQQALPHLLHYLREECGHPGIRTGRIIRRRSALTQAP